MADPISPMPQDVLEKLHEATGRFSDGRKRLEEEMDAAEQDHQKRVDAAAEQLRQAEREVEQAEEKIKELLPPSG